MPYVYILRGADGRLYTGTSWNLSQRFEPGVTEFGVRSPAQRLPLQLVFVEWHERIDEAYYRERQIRAWRRWRKDRLIADWNRASKLEP